MSRVKEALVVIIVVVLLVACYLWVESNNQQPTTVFSVADYYSQRSRVHPMPVVAAEIKATIRPAVVAALSEGYELIDDFVVCSGRTPDMYFTSYWVLLKSPTGEAVVKKMVFPHAADALIYFRYTSGNYPHRLPDVQLIGDELYVVREEDLN